MGVLADIFSYGNGLKRKVNNVLADPAGAIDLGVRRFGEDQNALLNLASNAYPMAGEKTVLNSPEQIAGFRKQLADKASEQAIAAATVWHGSPHKFDKFDSSKIGTGEGAQAYGHGLYLAENPSVAREYQEKLSSVGSAKNLAAQYGDIDKGIAEAQRRIASYKELIANGGGGMPERAQGMLRLSEKNLQDLTAMKQGLPENTGALYKVDLPDEHIAKMLDWDKPLSQQHPDVQAYAQKVLEPQIKGSQKVADGWGDLSAPYNLMDEMTGSQFLQSLRDGKATASNITGGGGPEVSSALKSAGIPGIRYLDGGSRGAGQGSSNFVVFPGNEGLLSIMERNGQPVLNKLLGK